MMLAYDYLELLVKQGNTMGSIAKKYDVSRANVNQLYTGLKKILSTNES
jgi:LysM repeat protein